MGTSLTGLTPATTYDALIKVGDNGPLSATAKVLSDGLGNDSPLAMSTTLVGIGTATPQTLLHLSSGNPIFLLEETDQVADAKRWGIQSETSILKFRAFNDALSSAVDVLSLTRVGNVGIGTISPTAKLDVAGTILTNSALVGNNSNNLYLSSNSTAGEVSIWANNLNTRLLTLIDGYARLASGTGGIQFNGDTAAANALDDYEEGTWTPNFTLDSGSVSAYTSGGSYTKIGRQVSLTMSITFTTTISASINEITGLPFTAQNLPQNAIGAVRESTNTGSMWQWRVNANATQGLLRKYDNTQSISNGDTFIGTLTYFV